MGVRYNCKLCSFKLYSRCIHIFCLRKSVNDNNDAIQPTLHENADQFFIENSKELETRLNTVASSDKRRVCINTFASRNN